MNSQLDSLLKPSDSPDSPGDIRSVRRGPRDWRSRFATALPWLMLLSFFALLAGIFGKRLIPATELTIASVVTVRQSADAIVGSSPDESASSGNVVDDSLWAEAPMLFQASGWVEPDPYHTMASVLMDGVINTVHALEGERVKKGQLLATLIDDEARLDLQTAESQAASLKAQASGHQRQIEIVEAEIVSLSRRVAVARARRDEAADIVNRYEEISKGTVAEREIFEARLRLTTNEAEIEALVVTELELEAKIKQLEEIQSDFSARVAEAQTDVARKQLMLDRTRIESPINGRILRLPVMPGQKRMLGGDNIDSATVAVLYDPENLQARIDVPLAEAAKLAVGQPVRLRSELLPGKVFRGEVTRIVGEADLQRNTLQAKVAIENPDERLRPEMLCRAEFLEVAGTSDSEMPTTESRGASGGDRVQIFVPADALVGESTVWKVDRSGMRVVPQEIVLGREERDNHRLVIEGLKPGDRVVLNPPPDLESGVRFHSSESNQPASES